MTYTIEQGQHVGKQAEKQVWSKFSVCCEITLLCLLFYC